MNKNQIVKYCLAFAIACMLAACGPKVENNGYVQEPGIKDKIIVGQSSKEDVHTLLGSPSAQSTFGDETWYYITDKKETVAFLRPEVTDQNVLRIVFDANGKVSKVENYNMDASDQGFALVKRTTPTEGHTLGFFEQVLGNIGRFNGPSNGSDSSAPGRKPSGGI